MLGDCLSWLSPGECTAKRARYKRYLMRLGATDPDSMSGAAAAPAAARTGADAEADKHPVQPRVVYTNSGQDDRGYTNGLYLGRGAALVPLLSRPWAWSDVPDREFNRTLGVDCRSDYVKIPDPMTPAFYARHVPLYNYECGLLEAFVVNGIQRKVFKQ